MHGGGYFLKGTVSFSSSALGVVDCWFPFLLLAHDLDPGLRWFLKKVSLLPSCCVVSCLWRGGVTVAGHSRTKGSASSASDVLPSRVLPPLVIISQEVWALVISCLMFSSGVFDHEISDLE